MTFSSNGFINNDILFKWVHKLNVDKLIIIEAQLCQVLHIALSYNFV